jgi:NitT/TauT family transport system substrate-binding protein
VEARHDSDVGIGRKTTRALVLLVAITAAFGVSACGASRNEGGDADSIDPLTVQVPPSTIPADTPVEPGVFRVTGQRSLAFELVRAGAALGFVGREGLSMRLTEADSEKAVLTALRSGAVDAAVVSSEQALSLASQGQELSIVLLLTTVTSGEVILADAATEDVAGLVGQRVAYAPGSRGELLLRGTLAVADVPVTEVDLVRAGGLNPALRLIAGTANAAVVDRPQALAAEGVASEGATAEVIELATAGDQPGLLSHVLVIRDSSAAAQPGRLLAFIRAWQALYLYEREAIETIAAGIAERQGVEVKEAMLNLSGSTLYDVPANGVDLLPGGEYYDETLRQIRAAATAAGWLEGPVDERALIDGSFAQVVASQP